MAKKAQLVKFSTAWTIENFGQFLSSASTIHDFEFIVSENFSILAGKLCDADLELSVDPDTGPDKWQYMSVFVILNTYLYEPVQVKCKVWQKGCCSQEKSSQEINFCRIETVHRVARIEFARFLHRGAIYGDNVTIYCNVEITIPNPSTAHVISADHSRAPFLHKFRNRNFLYDGVPKLVSFNPNHRLDPFCYRWEIEHFSELRELHESRIADPDDLLLMSDVFGTAIGPNKFVLVLHPRGNGSSFNDRPTVRLCQLISLSKKERVQFRFTYQYGDLVTFTTAGNTEQLSSVNCLVDSDRLKQEDDARKAELACEENNISQALDKPETRWQLIYEGQRPRRKRIHKLNSDLDRVKEILEQCSSKPADTLVVTVEGHVIRSDLSKRHEQGFVFEYAKNSFDVRKISSRCSFTHHCIVESADELLELSRGWPMIILPSQKYTVNVGTDKPVERGLSLHVVMFPRGLPHDEFEDHVSFMMFINWHKLEGTRCGVDTDTLFMQFKLYIIDSKGKQRNITDSLNRMDKNVLTSTQLLKFIKRTELLDSDEKYLNEDKLTIGIECEILSHPHTELSPTDLININAFFCATKLNCHPTKISWFNPKYNRIPFKHKWTMQNFQLCFTQHTYEAHCWESQFVAKRTREQEQLQFKVLFYPFGIENDGNVSVCLKLEPVTDLILVDKKEEPGKQNETKTGENEANEEESKIDQEEKTSIQSSEESKEILVQFKFSLLNKEGRRYNIKSSINRYEADNSDKDTWGMKEFISINSLKEKLKSENEEKKETKPANKKDTGKKESDEQEEVKEPEKEKPQTLTLYLEGEVLLVDEESMPSVCLVNYNQLFINRTNLQESVSALAAKNSDVQKLLGIETTVEELKRSEAQTERLARNAAEGQQVLPKQIINHFHDGVFNFDSSVVTDNIGFRERLELVKKTKEDQPATQAEPNQQAQQGAPAQPVQRANNPK